MALQKILQRPVEDGEKGSGSVADGGLAVHSPDLVEYTEINVLGHVFDDHFQGLVLTGDGNGPVGVVGGVELLRLLPDDLTGFQILEHVADEQPHLVAGGIGDAVPGNRGQVDGGDLTGEDKVGAALFLGQIQGLGFLEPARQG